MWSASSTSSTAGAERCSCSRFVPAGALADRAAPDPDLVVTHLTTAVERLHRLGLAHGALRPEHVLLEADGRPVLCGFGAAHRSRDRDPDATALAALIHTVRSGT